MSRLYGRFGLIARRVILCGVAVLVAAPTSVRAARVVSVEEHWELQLGQPDSDRSAPQTTMVLSPVDHLDGVHFLFTLNHQTTPQYAPGGMQVQVWDGEAFLEASESNPNCALQNAAETVRWVQRITLDNGTLTFQVLNGESDTWGAFGGDDLSLSVPTSLIKLNGYRPGVSLAESQVSYAENRVASLILTKIVWTTEEGEVYELNAPIAVDTSLDP